MPVSTLTSPARTAEEPMTRELRAAGDGLMAVIDELRALASSWEVAVDELINVAFSAGEPPPHVGIPAVELAALRVRLQRTGRTWCAAVTEATR